MGSIVLVEPSLTARKDMIANMKPNREMSQWTIDSVSHRGQVYPRVVPEVP